MGSSSQDVLIGTPSAQPGDNDIKEILEQLTKRQVAKEQITTYESEMKASEKERELNEVQAKARQQSSLTESAIQIEVADNEGKAEAIKAQREAEKIETMAKAEKVKKQQEIEAEAYEIKQKAEANKMKAEMEAEAKKITSDAEAYELTAKAKAEAERIEKVGKAESDKIKLIGKAEADALKLKVEAYADYSAQSKTGRFLFNKPSMRGRKVGLLSSFLHTLYIFLLNVCSS